MERILYKEDVAGRACQSVCCARLGFEKATRAGQWRLERDGFDLGGARSSDVEGLPRPRSRHKRRSIYRGNLEGLMIGLIREAFRVAVLSPFRLQHASAYVTTGVTLS